MKKTLTGLMAVAVIAGTLAASATDADAQWRRRGGWLGSRPSSAGILGGAIVGAAPSPGDGPPWLAGWSLSGLSRAGLSLRLLLGERAGL